MFAIRSKPLFARTVLSSFVGFASASLVAQTPYAAVHKVPPPSRPNILIIALDDVGFSDLGCYGSEIHTPSIDSIAQHGVRFTDFQTKAICSLTRASLMTGRNPQTVGMDDLPDVAPKDENVPAKMTGIIPANAEMLPEALVQAGDA
jgi:arylsulfatase